MVSWKESCRQGTQFSTILFTSSNAIDPPTLIFRFIYKPIMIAPSLNTQTLNLKFLCSYGGKILPRYPDGKLRYHGGHTRVLSVPRSISFSELLVKLGELCGSNCVSLRCQLPTEDLDALVSITSDEDLFNLIEEYDGAESVKIRAVLSLPKTASPPLSSASNSPKSPSPKAANGCHGNSRFSPLVSADHFTRHTPTTQAGYAMLRNKTAGKLPCYANGNPMRVQLIHNANHWQ